MPKLKSNSSAKKRFSFTKTGMVKRKQTLRGHFLTHKTTKKKRALRKMAYAAEVNTPAVRKLLPYA